MTSIQTDLHALQSLVDARFDEQVAFLADMVRTASDNPPGDCTPHAELTAARLEALGFEVEKHPVPEALCQDNGMIGATNLIVRHRFGDGPVIALNAHGDVVPPGDGWSVDPYGAEIRDGWMYGRGVAVSKSDFATYAFALLALKESGRRYGGTVELHFTYDEEVGGRIGPEWLLKNGLTRPDMVISAGFSHNIVTAHNGCLHLEVEMRGRSAHAARPETGHDALRAATRVLEALYALNDRLGDIHSAIDGIDTPSVTVGLIEGGINTNVVPDRVTFRLDRRMIPEEDAEQVEADLRELIETTASGCNGISTDIRRVLLAQALAPLPGTDRLVDVLKRGAEDTFGGDIGVVGVPLYTDARLYMEAGIPTAIYGAGPKTLLEANAHRADERLPLEDLKGATVVIAAVLAELLAV